MPDTTERCPWCDSVISRSKFMQIETKIREQEQTKLAEAEKQLRLQLQAEHAADVAKQRQAIEATIKSEANKQIASATAERDRMAEGLKLAQTSEAALRASMLQQAETMLKAKLQELEP